MKLNRKLVLVVALVMSLALVTTGTLAYLTDRDSEVNTFTMGNVDIELREDFEQGAELIPGLDIEKEPTITNMGPNDAWVWATIAIPAALDNDDASKNVLHFNMSKESVAEGKWTWWEEGTRDKWLKQYDVEYEGVKYNVFTVLYQTALKKGDTTEPVIYKVYLDPHVDINPDGELYHVENGTATELGLNIKEDGNPKIYVSAYAMQTDKFDNVYDAYAAYTQQWGTNANENAITWGEDGGKTDSGIPEIPEDADTWDGTSDTSWYNDSDSEFMIMTAEQLAGFAELVDGGKTFDGKTVKLGKNINLYAEDDEGNRVNFNPIGHSSNGNSFNGTFDGQNHTISNLYMQNDLGAWQYEGEYYALFAYTENATIKNVTVDDAYISSGRNEAAGVVGNAVNTTFADISIEGTTLIAYNNSAGGVAAECYGTCSFTDITVDDKTVIGPLWGTYDVRLGGVVGMVESSDKVSFSNVSVSCKLDAINDVASNYQWYNYRYSGMLIGQVDGVNGVADPTGYVTCENVTVTYGDWVNYHYCEDSSYGTPSYASEGQYKFNRVEAGTGTDGIDLSTCDHDENETHNLQIIFDQLFGGGQGVSGLNTYDGVTVNYPN